MRPLTKKFNPDTVLGGFLSVYREELIKRKPERLFSAHFFDRDQISGLTLDRIRGLDWAMSPSGLLQLKTALWGRHTAMCKDLDDVRGSAVRDALRSRIGEWAVLRRGFIYIGQRDGESEVKVGMTRRESVESRAKELNGANMRVAFNILYHVAVPDAVYAEARLHAIWKAMGLHAEKEFFSGAIPQLIYDMHEVAALEQVLFDFLIDRYCDGEVPNGSKNETKAAAEAD